MYKIPVLAKSAFNTLRTAVEWLKRWQRETGRAEQTWLAIYLIIIPILTELTKYHLRQKLSLISPTLMSTFHTPGMPPINSSLINFIGLIAAIFGCVAIRWLARIYSGRIRLPVLHPYVLIAVSIVVLVKLSIFIANVMVGMALAILIGLIVNPPPQSSIIRPHPPAVDIDVPSKKESAKWRSLKILLCVLPLVVVALVLVRSWYPLVLPNDYIELSDNLRTDLLTGNGSLLAGQSLTRDEAKACIIRDQQQTHMLNPNYKVMGPCFRPDKDTRYGKMQAACPLCMGESVAANSALAIDETGKWQSQLGRLLYHHAYLFVPAGHLLSHGFTGDMPMLYGIGHTAFYTLFMAFSGHTLAAYFNAYFAGIIIGMLWLACIVWAITRSRLAGLSALLMCAGLYFSIAFEYTLHAAGFSPLRFAGMLLQVASIFYLFKAGPRKGLLAMWISLLLSLVWNTEFAVIAFSGQALAMISPGLVLGFYKRVAAIIGLVATIALFFLLKADAEKGLMITSNLMALGISTPAIPRKYFTLLWVATTIILFMFARLARSYNLAACHARLCLLPILALMMIKYVIYPIPAHLFFALSFSLPLLLLYFPHWHNESSMGQWRRICLPRAKYILFGLCAVFAVAKATHYHLEAQNFRQVFIKPFVVEQWQGLADTIHAVVSDEELAKRVQSINEVSGRGDTLLLLSPFDHLLAFYTRPSQLCGHFELLSNVVTTDIVDAIASCTRTKPDLLVVFDKALESGCPLDKDFIHYPSCHFKQLAKDSMVRIRDRMLRDLTIVKETDELILYRVKPELKP